MCAGSSRPGDGTHATHTGSTHELAFPGGLTETITSEIDLRWSQFGVRTNKPLDPPFQMLHAGVPIAIVSQRLGHARASTTLNVYAHVVPGADNDAAQVLGRRIRQAALMGSSST